MSTAKLKILEDTFNLPFDLEQFKRFTKELFNELEIFPNKRSVGIWREYNDHISAYYKIGNYEDTEDNKLKLIVLAVEIKQGKSVERARTMQRNFISKVLDENGYDAAIVAFYSADEKNWRLSFVRLDYSFTDKGLDLDLTPARRYSYLVGKDEPSHTAKAQLLPIFENDKVNPTLAELEDAFSVEKVTKDFFKQYKAKYIEVKEYLEKNEAFIEEAEKLGFEVSKFAEQFSKKLLGQLAFLYFLQKKGWLGVRIIPKKITKEDLQHIYNSVDSVKKEMLTKVYHQEKDKGYKLDTILIASDSFSDHDVKTLTNIFLKSKFDKEWGSGYKKFIVDVLWRHCSENKGFFFNDYLEPFFYEALNKKRDNQYFKKFNCKIPFLNGGLFEPLEGYHWRDVNFSIPNDLFSNEKEKGRDSDGILDMFERYNFTINEAEPLEKEVAVDPEMLGKIFENLLDVTDRKSKGAFYTPREIVHYMCQESLTNYLVNEVGVPYEDMKQFILYGALIRDTDSRSGVGFNKGLSLKPTIYQNIVKIDKALENVKVADPAVGSGAFPLGMLSEIVMARNNITDYFVIMDKTGELGRKFGETTIRKNRSPFLLKWKTIKNSIFAVDIEPSAVDIAKLRLWLSVVIDQDIDAETPEPHPLPNLDMNIMVGNSLIDEYEGIKLFDESIIKKRNDKVGEAGREYAASLENQLSLFVDHSDEILEKMFKLQDLYFDEINEIRKKELKQQIDQLRDGLIEYKLDRDSNREGYEKYKELKKNKQRPYFLWHLEFAKVFQEKNGFDIVIGNPPYIGFHKVPNKEIFKEKYHSASGKYDFYVLFIEKGLNLLKEKGAISYICPSYFYKRNYGKNIRELFLIGTRLQYICDFKDFQIFDAALTYTCIFLAEKNSNNNNNRVRIINPNLSKNEYHVIDQNSLKEPSWAIEKNEFQGIINKVKRTSNTNLGKITKSISQGVVTGNNNVFIISEEFKRSNNMNDNFLVKVYKGKDIRNGKIQANDNYLFYPYEIDETGKNRLILDEEIKNNNPHLYFYLESKKEELLSRGYFVKSSKNWYELWNPRKRTHFESRKFVFSEVNDHNDFVLVDECFYSDSACGMELKEQYLKYEVYLKKYLNSKIITFLYRHISVPKANGYLIYKNAFLKELPIILVDDINLEDENFEEKLIAIFNLSEEEVELINQNTAIGSGK